MKAIICTAYGAPEVLKISDIDKPVPKANQILIQTYATSVTAGDRRMRALDVPSSFRIFARLFLGVFKPRKPIPGMEFAGKVIEVGKKVSRFKVGDKIYGSTGNSFGAYAEFTCLPEKNVMAPLPVNLNFAEAAVLSVGARTALYFLQEAKLKKGQHVLIYGASGSVGTYAIQIAKHYGAKVTAVCSAGNSSLVLELGADETIDYKTTDFTQNGVLYDVIFDTIGILNISQTAKSLKQQGAYLHAVGSPSVMLKMKKEGRLTGKTFIGGGPPENVDDLLFLNKLIENGELKPFIDKTFTLNEIVEAHRYVDTGRKRGNVSVLIRE